jgi:hypothetical protein
LIFFSLIRRMVATKDRKVQAWFAFAPEDEIRKPRSSKGISSSSFGAPRWSFISTAI